MPDLDCNFLSISKLTRDLNFVTKIFPNLCVFQDLELRKTIGLLQSVMGSYSIMIKAHQQVHPKFRSVLLLFLAHSSIHQSIKIMKLCNYTTSQVILISFIFPNCFPIFSKIKILLCSTVRSVNLPSILEHLIHALHICTHFLLVLQEQLPICDSISILNFLKMIDPCSDMRIRSRP